MKYWVAKDKNGTIHLSNVKPIKPSEFYKDNPNANNEIFWVFENAQEGTFFIVLNYDIPGLTFENSPQEVVFNLK